MKILYELFKDDVLIMVATEDRVLSYIEGRVHNARYLLVRHGGVVYVGDTGYVYRGVV